MNKPTDKQERIAAVFATMNRSSTALACVRALAAQTRPPDLVVVADNVSTDDTVSILESLQNLPFPLIIDRMRENRGNAGGVREAMDLAFDKGVDSVWILDDDSWPQPEALEKLTRDGLKNDVVRHSMQIDPKTGKFTWPLQIRDGAHSWKLINSTDQMPEGDFIQSRIIWTGALLPRIVWERTGPVNADLFIRGEDEEYPWRFEQAGFTQEAAVHSILDHPGPDDLIHISLLGKHFFFERGLADWKLYYKVRNMVWLKRKQSGSIKAMAMFFTYALGATWVDGAQRVPLILEAARDGWNGRLGKWSKHP